MDRGRRPAHRGLCQESCIQPAKRGQERSGLQPQHGKLSDQLQGHAGRRTACRREAGRDTPDGRKHALLPVRPDRGNPDPLTVRRRGGRHHRRTETSGRYFAGQRGQAPDPRAGLWQDVQRPEGHAGKRQHDDRRGLQPAQSDLRRHRREHELPVQAHLGRQGELRGIAGRCLFRHQRGRAVLQRYAGSQPDLQRAAVYPEGQRSRPDR